MAISTSVSRLQATTQILDDEGSGNPHFRIGVGLAIPEILPLELTFELDRRHHFLIRVSPAIPFEIVVEYGRSVLSNSDGLSVENPDLDVRFQGSWGPHSAVAYRFFPWQQNFYLTAAYGHRAWSLAGNLESNAILTSSSGSVNTNSKISLSASAELKQWYSHWGGGWSWSLDDQQRSHLNLEWGLQFYQGPDLAVSVRAEVFNPLATEPVTLDSIELAERELEANLSRDIRQSFVVFDELILPAVSLSYSFRF